MAPATCALAQPIAPIRNRKLAAPLLPMGSRNNALSNWTRLVKSPSWAALVSTMWAMQQRCWVRSGFGCARARTAMRSQHCPMSTSAFSAVHALMSTAPLHRIKHFPPPVAPTYWTRTAIPCSATTGTPNAAASPRWTPTILWPAWMVAMPPSAPPAAATTVT